MISFRYKVRSVDFAAGKAQLQAAVGRATGNALLDMGTYVRTVAQRSMRKAKNRALDSPPGAPPRAHDFDRFGRAQKNLRSLMVAVPDAATRSVLVGPAKFGARAVVPELMERGGSAIVGNDRRRLRKLGGSGEISILVGGEFVGPLDAFSIRARRRRRRGSKAWRTVKPVLRDPLNRRVAYIRLKTAKQVARANAINELLYGAWERRTATYAARPYMRPAFERSIPRFAQFFRERITGSRDG